MFGTSGTKAELGEVLFDTVVVVQFDSTPVAEVVQPVGSAGAVTSSKFSVKTRLLGPLYITLI